MIRAAVYARKSCDDSDRDAEAQSCQRQIDAATRYATEQGWVVDPRHVYRDDAVSGAEWKHRDGWNKLLADLEPSPAFSRLIVSELSRIGRDTVRTPAAILAVEEAGVEIFSYLGRQQITLSSEMGEMSTTLQSLLASFERRRASERTKDALRRRAEAGAATGGPPYGYGTMRNGDGYSRFVINPIEAGVVREIFQWFDEGAGVMRIAKRLNEQGVAAPRGGRKGWAPVSVSQLLRRPIYAGVRVWNQRRNVMRGGTRGSQQARPAEEWITQGLPELALIDRETFDRVQGRLAERSALYLRTTTGQLIGRPRLTDGDPRYLLTGLLRCTCCNGALGPHTGGGRGRRSYYRCSAHHHRGLVGCRNGLRVLVDEVDRRVLDAVAKALAPETVKEAIQGAVALLTAQQAEAASQRGALTAELASVEARTRRLVDALAEGRASRRFVHGSARRRSSATG